MLFKIGDKIKANPSHPFWVDNLWFHKGYRDEGFVTCVNKHTFMVAWRGDKGLASFYRPERVLDGIFLHYEDEELDDFF